MEIKSEIEVSIVENMNSSNVDGAIDNQDICKVEEDEVEELKFESNCVKRIFSVAGMGALTDILFGYEFISPVKLLSI